MHFQIKKIQAKETLTIRHKVLWPNKPLDYVKLPDDATGDHFGLFVEDRLIAIISLFIKDNKVQFRKFATLQDFQGKGYGSALLQYIIDVIKKENYQKLWCNARVDKVGFYHKFEFKETNTRFTKGGIDFVVIERCF